VILFRARCLCPGVRVVIQCTELLSAFPTPGAPASRPYTKGPLRFKAACEYVVTRFIFQKPALAPGTLFRIIGARHSFNTGVKKFRCLNVMVLILTLAIGEDFRKSLGPALRSKREYAQRHGYRYIQGGEEFWDRTRPIPWSKVEFVINTLCEIPDGQLVFLSDADVLITNSDIRLEDNVLPLLPPQKDLLMTIDACGHLNSGNMLMRNSPWLRDWWKRVGQQTDLLYHIWWENAAMIRLLETVPADLAKTETTAEHWRFNAYLRGIPGQPLWLPGHFLVHFAGVYDTKKMEELQAEILRGKVPRLPL
jgi:hypothetical protein